MKVIIVEVTRAANSFGAHPSARDPPRLRVDRQDRRRRPRPRASSATTSTRRLRLDVVLRGDRAAALGLGLRADPRRRRGLRARARDGRRDDLRRARDGRAPSRSGWFTRPHLRVARPGRPGSELQMDNDIVKRLVWAGLLAAIGALASIAAHRLAAVVWYRGLQRGPARVSHETRTAAGPDRGRPRSVGELVFDVSERVSILVREEIELAKTEVTEKVTTLLRGARRRDRRRGLRLPRPDPADARHRLAAQRPLLRDDVWIGFMVEALFWFVVAAGAGYFAYRSLPEGLAADARPRDRGGQARAPDARGRHHPVAREP